MIRLAHYCLAVLVPQLFSSSFLLFCLTSHVITREVRALLRILVKVLESTVLAPSFSTRTPVLQLYSTTVSQNQNQNQNQSISTSLILLALAYCLLLGTLSLWERNKQQKLHQHQHQQRKTSQPRFSACNSTRQSSMRLSWHEVEKKRTLWSKKQFQDHWKRGRRHY